MQETRIIGGGATAIHREFFRAMAQEAITQRMNDRLTELKPQGHKLVRRVHKIGRNDPCPCASGKKFKKCCISKAR